MFMMTTTMMRLKIIRVNEIKNQILTKMRMNLKEMNLNSKIVSSINQGKKIIIINQNLI